MQKIIQILFLILVCTATLAGRPIFDMDELFILFTGLIGFAGLVLRSDTERRLRIIDILFLMAIVFGLANERVFNVDLTIKYLSMAGVWFFVKESDSPRFESPNGPTPICRKMRPKNKRKNISKQTAN